MKKTLLRKVIAITMALTVALTMGMNVFAADQEDLGKDESLKPADNKAVISDAGVAQEGKDAGETIQGDAGKYGIYSPVANTVRIVKEIVVFNTKGTGDDKVLVYLPNITYTYSVEAATVAEDKHIKDEYALSATIQSGVGGAIKTASATVSYSNENGIKTGNTTIEATPYVLTNQSGVAAAGYFDVEFDPTKFTKPGVYRYSITEADSSRATSGVTNDKEKYKDTRYLDVYVQNKAGSTTGEVEIYGYALYEDKADKGADTEFDAANKKLAAKTNGFVSNKNDDGTTAYSPKEKDVDIYQTANVKVEKKVAGAMGDKTNPFPFYAKVENTAITSGAKISYQIVPEGGNLNLAKTNPSTKTMSNAGVAEIGAAAADVLDGLELKDTEYVYVYGIPGKGDGSTFNDKFSTLSTVLVKEFNNTTDTYDVTAKYNDADVTVTNEETPKATAASVANQNIAFKTTEDYMVVTNTLNSISPTNVVTRYAPFLLILAAAILLLVLRRRSRSSEEA